MEHADRASAASRARLRAQRERLEQERTRAFLRTQTALLAIGGGTALAANFLGQASQLIIVQSIVFTLVMGVITAVGWVTFHRRLATTSVVVGLLYVDSVVVLFFLYVGGEFEVAIGLAACLLIMAPIYAGTRHVWGIAAFQTVVFGGLLACRQFDLLQYGELLPLAELTRIDFVVEQAGAFLAVTFAVAYLAGRASIDILNSQRELEDAVAQQTRRLARANAELAEANAELRDTNAALDQFNTAVSHDLRSPLQTISGNLELLEATEPGLSDKGQSRLVQVSSALERMSAMIAELHHLSRLTGRLDHTAQVPLEAVVDAAQRDLGIRFEKASGEMEIRSPLPVAAGNASLLAQVIRNLLENALKYGCPGNPRVLVEPVESPDGFVSIAVEDNGEGIRDDDARLVFQMFKRLERHAEFEGIGAGLAIARRIVEAHGGRISVGRGATLGGARFVLELPAPPVGERGLFDSADHVKIPLPEGRAHDSTRH